jgi:hypothetical protein
MHKKSFLLYAICFTLSAGIAGTAGFIFSPARKETVVEETQPSQSANGAIHHGNSEDEDGGDDFIPVELNARDHFIDNLTQMKVLTGHAEANVSFKGYDVNVNVKEIYLTLETLTQPELYVDASITFMNKEFPIEVTYADGTIYLSVLDNDIKLATSDFSQITDMLASFNLPEFELPESIASINLDKVQSILGEMPFEETDTGYKYTFELFEGAPIIFYSDAEYNFTGIEVNNLSLEGITASVSGEVHVDYQIEKPVAIPETLDRQFVNFNDVLPLAKHIGDLINQKQFALSLSGSILKEGDTKGVTFNGSTQFDLESKTGAGRIDITEHECEKLYEHMVVLDVSEEDIVFDYNSIIKGRLRYASLESIIEMINSLMGNASEELPTSIDGAVSLLEGTVLKSVLDGNYEALLNDVIKNLRITSNQISLTVDKSFLGLDGDIDIAVNFSSEKLIGVSLSNIKVLGRTINVDVNLAEYDVNYSTGIDRNNLTEYADAQNLVPLVSGIKKLVEQKQFALRVEGSLKTTSQAKGLTFNGSTQFDLESKTGDGEITVVDNESSFSTKPSHNIKIGVDDQDVRIRYNEKLSCKFTIQTIKDIFGIATGLMNDETSRIYQWFGDKIDSMNETILSRMLNGEYALIFHNIIKEVSLTDNELRLTVSGELFNMENDVTVEVSFNEDGITSIHLVNFEAIGYVVDLKVDVVSWNESYSKLPLDNGSNYYNFSDIKTLAQLGLNVANLDYFHIKGTATINMDAVVDISALANLTDLPLEVEVFENNGDVCIKGTLKNIPTINSAVFGTIPNLLVAQNENYRSSLDFYYEGGYFYLTRHSYDAKVVLDIPTKYTARTDYVKTDREDFVDNILGYLMGWGMRLNECSTIWNAIKDAIADHAERTQAMDYASLLTNYSYTDKSTSSYGNNRWDIGLNIAELANNDQLKSCNATIYGKAMEFTNLEGEKETLDFLTHLDAALRIEASVLTLNLNASLNLVDIDPYLTYEDFETSSLTKTSYAQFRSYVNAHQNDSKVNF